MLTDRNQEKKTKSLVVFLALVVIGEVVWGIFYLTNPLKFFQDHPRPSPFLASVAQGAVLFLDPPLGEFTVVQGAPVEISVVLDSRGNLVLGTDAILRFDPNFWEVIDGDQKIEGVQIIPGTTFSRYLGNKVDPSQGRITFSGLAEFDQPFSGRGIVAKIQLAPKKKGITKIFFEYQPKATNDSNVAGIGAEDLLDKAVGGEYIIN